MNLIITTGDWIQIVLFIATIVGAYIRFEKRLIIIEEWRRKHEEWLEHQGELAQAQSKDLENRIEQLQRKDVMVVILQEINRRLEKIDQKLEVYNGNHK